MEKISGILPSSARVQNVDLSAAQPVRPGTPTFGRPVGVSTNDPATKAAREVATIQAMSDSFFMKNVKPQDNLVPAFDPSSSIQIDDLDQPEVGRYLDVQV